MSHPDLQELPEAGLRKDRPAEARRVELADRLKPGPVAPQMGALQHHDHLCSFHQSPSEELSVVAPFLQEGLRRGEACLCVTVDRTFDEIAHALKALGTDVELARQRQALNFVGKGQWRSQGDFDPDAMSARLKSLIERTLSAGFSGLWVAVDMTWALDPDIRPEALAEWEDSLNELACEMPVLFLSQYNCDRMPPEALLHELRTHPVIILGDQVCPNVFYEPPDIFLGRLPVADKARWAFDQLRHAAARETALRTSKEQFRLLVEGVKDYAIFMLNPKGYILTWNQGAERIKGYLAEEVIGKHFSIFYPPEDASAGKPESNLKVAASEGRLEDEGWRLRKDGSRYWANVVITALRDEHGNLRGFAKVTRDMTERKRAEDSMRELSGRLLQLQEEERRRLARELHDSTAQLLAAISLNLTTLREQIEAARNPRASQALTESIALADQASTELRTLSYLLHPPVLDEAGLEEALRWYIDGFVQRTNIKVELQLPSALGRLPQDMEIALFRIVQESLANIHRHSGSATAEIRLFPYKGHVVLEVADHGKGLPPGTREENGSPASTLGVGIRGMRERVRQLGGFLEFGSANPGAIVRAVLPLEEAAAPHRSTDQVP